jgi:alpha-beta hydrolase superfamily lysophospholipase
MLTTTILPSAEMLLSLLRRTAMFRLQVTPALLFDANKAQQLLVQQFSSPSPQRAVTLSQLERDSKLYLRFTEQQWNECKADARTLLDSAQREDVVHDGEPIATYCWSPDGPTRGRLLLCHGWEGYALNFALLISMALKQGFEVHAFDHAAHGASGGTKSGLPKALSGLRVVAARIGPVDAVIGHSLGGGAVAWAASNNALVAKRVVLLAPFFDTERLTNLWCMVHGIGASGAELLRRGLELDSGMTLAEFTAENLGPKATLPTLVVHDPKDRITRISESRKFVRSATQSQLVEMPGAGHIGILANAYAMQSVLEFATGSRSG